MKLVTVLAAVLVLAGVVQAFDRIVVCEEAYDEISDSCNAASSAMDMIMWQNHPGRVAAIEWHVNGAYPLFSYDALTKMQQYPPPQEGSYPAPWLWLDGVSQNEFYYLWESYVANEVGRPASVGITMIGSTYDAPSGLGTIHLQFNNSSGADITGNVWVFTTEDSVVDYSPNGDTMHNHVCRQLVQITGSNQITVPALGQETLAQDFSIDPNWNQNHCNMVVYLQDPNVESDSSMPIYQGAIARLMSWNGIQETRSVPVADELKAGPNPSRGVIRLQLGAGRSERTVLIRDAAGRIVQRVAAPQSSSGSTQLVDLHSAPDGVYFASLADRKAAPGAGQAAIKIVLQR